MAVIRTTLKKIEIFCKGQANVNHLDIGGRWQTSCWWRWSSLTLKEASKKKGLKKVVAIVLKGEGGEVGGHHFGCDISLHFDPYPLGNRNQNSSSWFWTLAYLIPASFDVGGYRFNICLIKTHGHIHRADLRSGLHSFIAWFISLKKSW